MNSIKKDEKYHNLEFIKMKMNFNKFKGMSKDYIKKENSAPSLPIPRIQIDKEKFTNENSLVWLGHSTILGNLDNVCFIIDPMLTNRASPFNWIGPKRFNGSLTPISELPNIDVILITHNHYDHLDKDTILSLKDNVKAIYVPLDNKQILIKWGVEETKIREFDWYEDILFNGVKFAFCPTQHFSGRSLTDRNKYLWSSWAIFGKEYSIYISGDSGYNEHFKMINLRYGSFDIACIECGAYNDNWSEIHMIPEESVQASIDLKAKVMLPMHWAGFDLSMHSWDEPIARAEKIAIDLGVTITTPIIGQILNLNRPIHNEKWWKRL